MVRGESRQSFAIWDGGSHRRHGPAKFQEFEYWEALSRLLFAVSRPGCRGFLAHIGAEGLGGAGSSRPVAFNGIYNGPCYVGLSLFAVEVGLIGAVCEVTCFHKDAGHGGSL